MTGLTRSTRATLAVLLLAIGVPAPSAADPGSDPTGVRIFFMRWAIRTRRPMTPDDLVREHHAYVEIKDAYMARELVRWLRLDQLVPRPERAPGDARLAIKIARADGSEETYYAAEDALYSADSTRSREIDAAFRSRFDFGKDPVKP